MGLLHTRSLSGTLDAVNEALFFGKRIPKDESRRVAGWIAARQGLPGSYAGMFAPTSQDYAHGIRLFTGERISTRAATAGAAFLSTTPCLRSRRLGEIARTMKSDTPLPRLSGC